MALDGLATLLARQYRFCSDVEPTGGWTIWYPDLPGCMTFATTYDQIGQRAREVFEVWMRSEVERGHTIPEPTAYPHDDFWPNGLDAELSPPLPQAFTAQEVAERLGVTRGRVHQLARAHELGRRVGNAKLFSDVEVARLAGMETHSRGRPRGASAA